MSQCRGCKKINVMHPMPNGVERRWQRTACTESAQVLQGAGPLRAPPNLTRPKLRPQSRPGGPPPPPRPRARGPQKVLPPPSPRLLGLLGGGAPWARRGCWAGRRRWAGRRGYGARGGVAPLSLPTPFGLVPPPARVHQSAPQAASRPRACSRSSGPQSGPPDFWKRGNQPAPPAARPSKQTQQGK